MKYKMAYTPVYIDHGGTAEIIPVQWQETDAYDEYEMALGEAILWMQAWVEAYWLDMKPRECDIFFCYKKIGDNSPTERLMISCPTYREHLYEDFFNHLVLLYEDNN